MVHCGASVNEDLVESASDTNKLDSTLHETQSFTRSVTHQTM